VNRRSAPQLVVAVSGLWALAACTELRAGDILPDAGARRTSSAKCAHAEPPGPPAGGNAAGGGSAPPERDYVFASSAYDVGDTVDGDGNARYPSLGYDLDHTCSGEGQGGSCKLPAWQTSPVMDGPEGRDNSSNRAFFLARSTLVMQAALERDAGNMSMAVSFDSNPDAQSGRTTVMLRIRGYNGEANDAQVALDMFSGTLWPDPNGGPKPHWDVRDLWHATSPWLRDGSTGNDARFSDARAYVNDNVLVAHLDSLSVGNAFAPAGTWRKVLITGRLARATSDAGDAMLELHDVKLIGRWPIDDLLAFVARTQDPSGTVRCTDNGLYDATRSFYCQNLDLSQVRDDGTAVCDAISIVYAIDTVPSQLGDPIAFEPRAWPECAALGCDGKPLPPH
jgi:hypothetical protein